MKRFIAVIVVIPCLLWLGCGLVQNSKSDNSNHINFAGLSVGQANSYVSFLIVNDTVKTYGKDTAIVQITDTLDGGYIFRAAFSRGSQSYVAGTPGLQYRARIQNDTCFSTLLAGNNPYLAQLIPQQNFPVSYASEGGFTFKRLSPTFCDTVIRQSFNKRTFNGIVSACQTSHFAFDALNIVIDYSAFFTTGIGYTWVFSSNIGFIYTMSYSPYSNSKTASGWELLP
jgi:hypothetical protein